MLQGLTVLGKIVAVPANQICFEVEVYGEHRRGSRGRLCALILFELIHEVRELTLDGRVVEALHVWSGLVLGLVHVLVHIFLGVFIDVFLDVFVHVFFVVLAVVG